MRDRKKIQQMIISHEMTAIHNIYNEYDDDDNIHLVSLKCHPPHLTAPGGSGCIKEKGASMRYVRYKCVVSSFFVVVHFLDLINEIPKNSRNSCCRRGRSSHCRKLMSGKKNINTS